MCLLINKGDMFIKAKEDITVYKMAIVSKASTQKIYSSYKRMLAGRVKNLPIHLKLNTQHVIRQKRTYGPDDKNSINVGFHSFIRLYDARSRAESWNECVFECVVPKGAWYIIGEFDTQDETQSIVSSQIIYKQWIRDYR